MKHRFIHLLGIAGLIAVFTTVAQGQIRRPPPASPWNGDDPVIITMALVAPDYGGDVSEILAPTSDPIPLYVDFTGSAPRYDAFIQADTSCGLLSQIVLTSLAGSIAYLSEETHPDLGFGWRLHADNDGYVLDTGYHLQIDVAQPGGGYLSVYDVTDSNTELKDQIFLLPEPGLVSLLALGGWSLARGRR